MIGKVNNQGTGGIGPSVTTDHNGNVLAIKGPVGFKEERQTQVKIVPVNQMNAPNLSRQNTLRKKDFSGQNSALGQIDVRSPLSDEFKSSSVMFQAHASDA